MCCGEGDRVRGNIEPVYIEERKGSPGVRASPTPEKGRRGLSVPRVAAPLPQHPSVESCHGAAEPTLLSRPETPCSPSHESGVHSLHWRTRKRFTTHDSMLQVRTTFFFARLTDGCTRD